MSARIVAAWEFKRFFKPKDQLIGLVIGLVVGLAFALVQHFIERGREPAVIVVLGEAMAIPARSPNELRFEPARGRSEEALRAAVDGKEIQGLLIAKDDRRAELFVRREPNWQPALVAALTEARQTTQLARSGIDPDRLAQVTAPVDIVLSYPDQVRGEGPERIVALVFLVLMLLGIFTGIGYVFAGITGEKQQRVTEQIVSAISPQSWVDGKILGLTAVSLASLLVNIVSILLFVAASHLFGRGINLPTSLGDPATIALTLWFTMLGFFFWLTFISAIAGTINDPNTSARSTLLFLPLGAVSTAFVILGDPDGTVARLLAQFPLTSMAVMPIRIVTGEPLVWEIILSALLLGGSIYVLRVFAGKIFGLSMLMYGKEPTLRELIRWSREA